MKVDNNTAGSMDFN